MAITVSGRALGSRRALFDDFSLPIDPDNFGDGLTLRELIERIVVAELQAYSQRHEARRLDRVLSRAEIARGAAEGRIAPEGRQTPPPPPADDAVGAALLAFEDGLYIVAIDGHEHRDLDSQVYITPDSRITFIRLVFLAGA
jgi:hypothetical protein